MRKLLFLISFIPLVSQAEPMPMQHGQQPPPCHSMGKNHNQQMNKPEKRGNKAFHIFTKLDLSEPQLNEVKYLLDQTHTDMLKQKQREHKLENELEWLATSLNYDSETADKLIQQLTELKSAQLKQKVATQQHIMGLLTEQQKATLAMQQKISLLDKY